MYSRPNTSNLFIAGSFCLFDIWKDAGNFNCVVMKHRAIDTTAFRTLEDIIIEICFTAKCPCLFHRSELDHTHGEHFKYILRLCIVK